MAGIGLGASIDVTVPSVPDIDVVIPVVVAVNGVTLTDNGDGTVTVTSSGSATITDNGDGTVTLNAI